RVARGELEAESLVALLRVRDAVRIGARIDAELDGEESCLVLLGLCREAQAPEQHREDGHAHGDAARCLGEVEAARIVVELGCDLVASWQGMHDDRFLEWSGGHRTL